MTVAYAPDGRFLSVSPDGMDWHIRLTRVSKNQWNEFALCHGRTLTAADVLRFLPNWESLQWSPLKKGMGPSKAITATDGEVDAAIIVMGNCPLAEEEIVREFKQFMADSACE